MNARATRSTLRLVVATTALFACLSTGAARALADSGRLVEFSAALTTRSPDSPTGLTLHVVFRRAEDPGAKPPPLRTEVIEGPAGLRFDTSTLTECQASDEELRVRGTDACPAESRLTVGAFSAVSGVGPPVDPLLADMHVFNGPNQVIEVIAGQGRSASPAFDRLKIAGSTLTANPPRVPGGPPDGEMAARSIDIAIPPHVARGKSLITTPPTCPADGRWTTTARFGFGDGSTETVTSHSPCDTVAARPAPGPPRLRLAIQPRRVRAGRLVSLRFRVTSSRPGCVSRARVQIGRRALRTNQAGRAVLRIRFRRPGIRTVTATHPGCRRATGRLQVSVVT